jgi:single-strand selective monofunctional uracil DNA glycosylase
VDPLVRISRDLAARLEPLRFGPPVAHVYHPLVYAREPWEAYLARYGRGKKEVVLVGMNPGPFGMAQVGVPFGDVPLVRDWLGITGRVTAPARMHPKRPILGFDCPRGEVSGARLWGLARERFGTPDAFFERFFVANYCPLAFLEESGLNRTPDKLPERERRPLFQACDAALRATVETLSPRLVVGVGKFAEGRARSALAGLPVAIGGIPHPSPASPAANRGWAAAAEKALADLGIALPPARS